MGQIGNVFWAKDFVDYHNYTFNANTKRCEYNNNLTCLIIDLAIQFQSQRYVYKCLYSGYRPVMIANVTCPVLFFLNTWLVKPSGSGRDSCKPWLPIGQHLSGQTCFDVKSTIVHRSQTKPVLSKLYILQK